MAPNRREGEITYHDLEALGDRFERRISEAKAELGAAMTDVKQTVLRQNGRIGKSEEAIKKSDEAIWHLRMALRDLKAGVSIDTIGGVATATQKTVDAVSKGKLFGYVVGALITMATFFATAHELGDALLKLIRR